MAVEKTVLKQIIIAIVLAVIIVIFGIFIFNYYPQDETIPEPATSTPEIIATPTPPVIVPPSKVIGKSVEGRDISSWTFGNGTNTIIFVGGIHGGYEWETTFLAYKIIDDLEKKNIAVPANQKIIIVPNLNPDATFKIIGKDGIYTELDTPTSTIEFWKTARFNANQVDLNRNFDCRWQAESTWQSKKVSAGTAAFSEPEAIAIRDLILAEQPKAVLFWHSASGNVYGAKCADEATPESMMELARLYAAAAGYRVKDVFADYDITGDVESWLSTIGIPGLTVELKTHGDMEYEQNLAGVKAVLEYFSQK